MEKPKKYCGELGNKIYIVFASIIIFIILTISSIYLGKENFLKKTECQVINKTYSTYECWGLLPEISKIKNEESSSFIECRNEYYQIYLDLIEINTVNVIRACDKIIIETLNCKCCENIKNQTCGNINININYDMNSPPIIRKNLDLYYEYEIGKYYPCWTNEKGILSLYDKSYELENICIIYIVISLIYFLSLIIYLICKSVYNFKEKNKKKKIKRIEFITSLEYL